MIINYKSKILTDRYRKEILKKYNVFGSAEQKQIDIDFDSFEQHLCNLKKDNFNVNDRFLVEWFDTDIYFEDFAYGVNLYNLITCFKNADIPLYTLLLITNCFGLNKEIQRLVPNRFDCPTVIQTLCACPHWSDNYNNIKNNVNKITKHAVCMMGAARVHRHAIFRLVEKHKLLDKIAVASGPTS